MFIVGWKPRTKYEIEVDDEEMREIETDAAGTMALDFPEGRDAGVRVKAVDAGVRINANLPQTFAASASARGFWNTPIQISRAWHEIAR